MKRKAMVGWMAVVWMALAAGSANAVTTVFQDRIDNYRWTAGSGKYYPDVCPSVRLTQGPSAGAIIASTGPWTAESGDEFVNLAGGGYQVFNTFAVTNTVTDRYGQIFMRIGYSTNPITVGLRIGMFNIDNPQFATWTAAGAGPWIYIEGGGGAWNQTSGSWASFTVPDHIFNITVNYDLQNLTYDFWVDSTLVGANLGFLTPGFGSTAQAVAIGAGDDVTPYTGNVLDQWYWKSDNATPFTSYGQQLPGPGPNIVKTVFEDQIKGYMPSGVAYTSVNARVIKTQMSGSANVITNAAVAVIPPGDEAVDLNSSAYFSFMTIAATNAEVTDRYGQIYARVALQATTYGQFLRLALFDTANPTFPSDFAWCVVSPANAAADLLWELTGGKFCYFNNGTYTVSSTAIPMGGQWHDVTMNYDLAAGTYDVWLNTNKIVASSTFEWAAFPTQACAIAIGSVYYTAEQTPLLDSWLWKTATTAPFSKWFIPPPPKGTIIMIR